MKCNTVKKGGSEVHVSCRATLTQRHRQLHHIEDTRKECHLVKCIVVEHAKVDLRSAGDRPATPAESWKWASVLLPCELPHKIWTLSCPSWPSRRHSLAGWSSHIRYFDGARPTVVRCGLPYSSFFLVFSGMASLATSKSSCEFKLLFVWLSVSSPILIKSM